MTSRKRLPRSLTVLAGVAAIAVPAAASSAAAAPSAKPADPDAGVLAAHLLDQEIGWTDCGFPAPYGEVPGLACADITVPRDWHNATDGNTITVRISKTETAGPKRQGIALVNPGGPGSGGLIWGAGMAVRAPELADEFDFIGFDPRGVGASTPLVCEYTPNPDATPAEDTRDQVNGCLENPLTEFINTEQTVYDMDFIRALLGEEKLSYIGYSYGTWLGKWYETEFPKRSHRFLLDSSTDLTRKSLQQTWDLQPRSRDRQFQEHLLPYIDRNSALVGAPDGDALELRRYWELAGGNRSFFGPLLMQYFILPAMYDNSAYPAIAALLAPILIEGYNKDNGIVPEETPELTLGEAAAEVKRLVDSAVRSGNLSAEEVQRLRSMERLALADVAEQVEIRSAAAEGESVEYDFVFQAIRCQDGQWNQSESYWQSWLEDLRKKAPWIAPYSGAPACRFWTAPTEMPKVKGNSLVPTLILQSELDAATPYEGGLKSAQNLKNSALISIDNEGSHGLFPYGTECVDNAVLDYFLDGTLPNRRFTTCGAVPLPEETEVFESGGTLGKHGKIKLRMITDDVREANKLFHRLMAEQAAAEQ